ncbi:hypothetical protein ACROYT_G033502 [Oculina patagonica]
MVSRCFGVLSFVVLLVFPSSLSQSCIESPSFGRALGKSGYATCFYQSFEEHGLLYVNGFKRETGPNVDLRGIKKANCCKPPEIHVGKPHTCTSADWDLSFKSEGWATCPSGHFLNGFHRGSSNELKSIQWAQCCKPALHPHWYKECVDEDVGSGDTWKCSRDNFYIVGLHRGASEKLSSINKLRCCSMYDKVLPLKSGDEVKTRTMDMTLDNLAVLATHLGYGWSKGCRGQYGGQDFIRDGDSWRSHYQRGCSGDKAKDRLKIFYENFSFKVKKLDYLEPEIVDMKPIVQDVGEINNEDSLPTKTSISREIKSVRTVTHSSSTRFKSTFDASVTLSYTSPGMFGLAAGTFKAYVTLSGGSESAGLNTDENGDIKWDIVKVKETQTTEGNAGSSYQITTSQKKVNVPYKATIQVQFTARLEGFLRKDNYHETYKGKGKGSFPYTFGTESVPFYKFLKQVSERDDSPWLWNQIKHGQWSDARNKYAQSIIDTLTDESLYEFELHGTFHDVAGLDFNVQWDDKPVSSLNATLAV